jgi:hypothetical protein
MAFAGPRRGPALLEEGATRESVSAECREAALAFMAGVANGWEKLDLARWLVGPYARAARHCQHGERTRLAQGAPVDAGTIEELLTSTRGRLLAALETAALEDGSLDLAESAIECGHVRRAMDEDGTEVWIPVDGARMRLRDRLGALFVADYLNDPAAYGSLYVCHRCEAVVFDEGARQLGMCSAHRRMSGIVPKSEESSSHDDLLAAIKR